MYFITNDKAECFGCEACVQICTHKAIKMAEDDEGFRYPVIDSSLCIDCGLCRNVCPCEHMPHKYEENKYAFGGYHIDPSTRFESTSGGASSAIVDAFCDDDYIIFGAEAKGLEAFHSFVSDKREMGKYRKSKYTQSIIGSSYQLVKKFLKENKKVLFSGTPCQIAGLISYLGKTNQDNLLTVEVICEGVPSPLYIKKLNDHVERKYGLPIDSIDYRYTGKSLFSHGKWDFEGMLLRIGELSNGKTRNKIIKKDRWFNPFWSIWLNHLMSRPSCYHCKFTTVGRVADITLGDLWGVHLYCPELYGKNGGSSLVVCNTEKGKRVFEAAKKNMYGHELKFMDALKYQSPMRRTISNNPDRDSFMQDLKSEMNYHSINTKWAKRPSIKLLYQKYVWGNRQKIFLWNLLRRR